MRRLGYPTALLGDSDRDFNPDKATMEASGAKVVLWGGDMALESRLADDLPWDGIVDMLELASAEWGAGHVRKEIAEKLGVEKSALQGAPATWPSSAKEEDLRRAVAVAAATARGKKGWFKRVDLAERLAAIVVKYWDVIKETDLRKKLRSLRKWMTDG